ncbi:hypothetical protein [Nitrospirillum viridazoti]|uniref:Uncharacterized protein n=2 Tax=Nitrospirillum TaxID=1543705 RepID=A0A560IHE8_9PROT|nr:hypothetical protein [Nitrospirillum amazonense]TWB56514.1 hypothetical protein FBZ92_111120 [Nitrospirillum amazonense]
MNAIPTRRLSAPAEATPVPPPVRPRYNPVEVIEGAAPSRLRSVALSLAAATLVALVLGAHPLADWVNGLPINPMTDRLSGWVQAWQDWTDAIGAGHLYTGLQALFRWFQGLRF